MSFIRAVLAGLAIVVLAPLSRGAAQDDTPALDARLEALVQTLDQRRQDLHIPGVAIAVVKDGQVVLARGLGVRDVEHNLPVEPGTTFAIGSTTKTFTSALVGIAVDEGRLGLDDHVRDHVPEFHLADEEANAGVSIRDLLCHRTGLTRMPLLWAGGEGTVDDMLAAVREAQLYAPFRSAWLYNNVTYAFAGVAVANAYDTTWEGLVETRILDPLAMTTATTSLSGLTPENGGALGYRWDDEKNAFERLPARDLHLIAPAGAINASVLDMSKWLELLLAHGEYTDADGNAQRLISAESLDACWSPQIDIGDGRSYGLGWMIGEYRGRRLVEHGGNIDGYCSALALMPDDGVGFTMLANVTGTQLMSEAIPLVFDALLGPEPPAADAPAETADDLARFAGRYAIEMLKGDMVIAVEDGHLTCDIPGQGKTALAPPDADGWRAFVVNPQAKCRFEPETGEVTTMAFRQGPLNLSLPRRAEDGTLMVTPLPFPVEQLQRYCGTYRFETLGVTCTVSLLDGQLMMDVPGQTNYVLKWDADKEVWAFRDFPGIELIFKTPDEPAPASAITLMQSGQTYDLPRIGSDAPDTLPTLDDLLAKRGESLGTGVLTDTTTMHLVGQVDMVNSGVKGTLESYAAGPRRYSTRIDLAPFGESRTVVTPDAAWSATPLTPARRDSANRAYAQQLMGHPWAVIDDPRRFAGDVSIVGTEATEDGHGAVIISLTPEHGPTHQLLIDPETGRTLTFRAAAEVSPGINIPVVIRLSDWREFDGLWYPCRQEVDNPSTGKSVVTIERVELGVDVPEGTFDIPAPPAPTPGG